ncbi:MAG TPA: OsmC family protein, partial [Longimicrobiales bacterium]|nr:OsmC family protein [Longimicrobiales bacterium]
DVEPQGGTPLAPGVRTMKIVLETEHRIRLVPDDAGFAFEAVEGGLSPFHLLAASLATCTYSVIHSWAHQAGLDMAGLEIVVAWEFGGDPVQVSRMDMDIAWPGLPPVRREAARRVAEHCTVHHTLMAPTTVETRVAANDEAGPADGA